jgi:hypothetical protein
MRRHAAALSVLAASIALLAPVPIASADSETFKDGKTTAGPMDIHRVSVVNENLLQIRIKVEDLQKKFGRSAGVYIDTDPDQKGPEYFIGSGLYQSDWSISEADGWAPGDEPLSCPVDQKLRYDDDVIAWRTGPECLGEYSKVRVSAEATKGDTTDYSPDRHEWHPWVQRY